MIIDLLIKKIWDVVIQKKACVDYAKGDICGFLDSDDALTPDALELMMRFHEEHNDGKVSQCH